MKLQDTRIYATSLELNRACATVVDKLPTGFGWLSDQLRRAACSVTLNFAEGFRRTSARERRHFFTISAASASEVIAAVDVANAYGLVREEDLRRVQDHADHCSAMLRMFR